MKKEYYVDDRQLRLLGACDAGRRRALRLLGVGTPKRIPITEATALRALAIPQHWYARYVAEMLIYKLQEASVFSWDQADDQVEVLRNLDPKDLVKRTRSLAAKLRKAVKEGRLAEDYMGVLSDPTTPWFEAARN